MAKKQYFHSCKFHLMKTAINLIFLSFIVVIFFACQKEVTGSISGSLSKGSLQNTAGNCLGSAVFGTYNKDAVLTSANYVNVNVQVDSIGTYSISTDTINGYYFKGVGGFTSTGVKIAKLVASGKPLSEGINTFTVKYNGTTCQFQVTVAASTGGGGGGGGGTAVYTISCSSPTLNGTYENGTAMTSANTVVLNVSVTTVGLWNLTTTATNGITFSGSGTFSATGSQAITLTASGTPSASGNFNIPVNNGTSSCSFPITFSVAAVVDWKLTIGTTTYQGNTNSAQLQNIGGLFTTFSYSGTNANSETLVFGIADLSGGINANETYSSTNTTGNSSGFVFNIQSGEIYSADNMTSNVNMIFKVTSHNTGTKTIQGTFSGTALNSSNVITTISNGQFKAIYQ